MPLNSVKVRFPPTASISDRTVQGTEALVACPLSRVANKSSTPRASSVRNERNHEASEFTKITLAEAIEDHIIGILMDGSQFLEQHSAIRRKCEDYPLIHFATQAR